MYQALTEKPVKAEFLFADLMKKEINFCKVLIALDVFEEMGLISRNRQTGEAAKLRVSQKVNLEDSAILAELRELSGMK